jgi:hypothetical protein
MSSTVRCFRLIEEVAQGEKSYPARPFRCMQLQIRFTQPVQVDVIGAAKAKETGQVSLMLFQVIAPIRFA